MAPKGSAGAPHAEDEGAQTLPLHVLFHYYQTILNKIPFISEESSIPSTFPVHRLNVKYLLSSSLSLPTLTTFTQNSKTFFQCR